MLRKDKNFLQKEIVMLQKLELKLKRENFFLFQLLLQFFFVFIFADVVKRNQVFKYLRYRKSS